MPDRPDRDELRARLRAKIGQARSSPSTATVAQQMRRDPTSVLMQLGVDDAKVLRKAPKLANNPKGFLQNDMVELLAKMQANAAQVAQVAQVAPSRHRADDGEEEDEEAPPPLQADEEAPPPLLSKTEEAPPPAAR